MKRSLFTVALMLLFIGVSPVLAANPSPPGPDSLNYGDLPTISDLAKIIIRIIYFLLGIAGSITIIYLVIGGIKYIIGGGDPKAVAGAKAHLTFAIIGLIVILLSITIVTIIGNLFGFHGLNVVNIPSPV